MYLSENKSLHKIANIPKQKEKERKKRWAIKVVEGNLE